MSDKKQLSERGIQAAEHYLSRAGYDVLEVNWECPAGRIDLIARQDDGTLVFANVHVRKGISDGFPLEVSITSKERSRFEKIAMWYLRDYVETDIAVRYDVIRMQIISEDRALIRHYTNASLAD